MKAKLGIQLWSVKKAFKADYKKTLKRIADLGFAGVEFAGFNDVLAQDMKACLDKNNLIALGSHTATDLLTDKLDEVIAYNKIIGNKNVICPFYQIESKEDIEKMIALFTPIAKKLEDNGLCFGYHNHAHEFQVFDGEYALDIFFNALPTIKPEIDTYWVFNAGKSPVDYCKKYVGRCELIHLKDGTSTTATPIGAGEMDIQSIINLADEIKVKWVVIEDETIDPEEFDAVEIGMANLKTKYTL